MHSTRKALLLLFALISLAGCGDQTPATTASLSTATVLSAQEPSAPIVTGDVATDGLNWFNYRRQQAGLAALLRSDTIDRAAGAHANYQQINSVTTHEENPTLSGYTGINVRQRLLAAGLNLPAEDYADAEVIAATQQSDGFAAAEGLLSAVYHRFVIFEPTFNQVGAGTSTRVDGTTWFTANLVLSPPAAGLGPGRIIYWPRAGQQNVRSNFFSNQETPDPVTALDEVGYPISVHADRDKVLRVARFVLRARGEPPLLAYLLDGLRDLETPLSAAALIPLQPLRSGTNYEVQFDGWVDDLAVSQRWSFTTR